MKKLNLKNEIFEDDEQLIGILRTSIGRAPSKQFVQATLDKILVLKNKEEKVHKPMRLPLYLMLVVGLILLAPVFLTSNIQLAPLSEQGIAFESLISDMTFQTGLWYILSSVLLGLALICMLWMELGRASYRRST